MQASSCAAFFPARLARKSNGLCAIRNRSDRPVPGIGADQHNNSGFPKTPATDQYFNPAGSWARRTRLIAAEGASIRVWLTGADLRTTGLPPHDSPYTSWASAGCVLDRPHPPCGNTTLDRPKVGTFPRGGRRNAPVVLHRRDRGSSAAMSCRICCNRDRPIVVDEIRLVPWPDHRSPKIPGRRRREIHVDLLRGWPAAAAAARCPRRCGVRRSWSWPRTRPPPAAAPGTAPAATTGSTLQ